MLLWAFDVVLLLLMRTLYFVIVIVGIVVARVLLLYCGMCVTIAIVIVGLHSDCICCWGVLVALGGKDIMVTKMLIENMLMPLLTIKDCWGEQTNTNRS